MRRGVVVLAVLLMLAPSAARAQDCRPADDSTTAILMGVACRQGEQQRQQRAAADAQSGTPAGRLVIRALIDNGRDPAYDFSPSIQNIVRRAPEIVALVVLRSPEVLTDEALLRAGLQDFVARALSGERLFGGWSQAQYVALMDRVRGADATSDRGAYLFGRLLAADDDVAVSLAYAGLAGGLTESLASSVRRVAESGCVRFRATVEAERPGVFLNCLDYLAREGMPSWMR